MTIKKLDEVFFENTNTCGCFDDNDELIAYHITPDGGYVIHTKFYDTPVIDEETLEETGEVIKGYTDSYIVIRSNYDFKENPFDIYAVKKGDENNG